jgi:hypothetical protein
LPLPLYQIGKMRLGVAVPLDKIHETLRTLTGISFAFTGAPGSSSHDLIGADRSHRFC